MMWLSEILLVAINIGMAAYHARLIKDEKKINHSLWGGAYLVVAGVLSLIIHSWVLFVLSLFIRKVVFDLSLNIFRRLPLFYVSLKPASLIDRFHNWAFGKRSEIYMGIYLLCIVVLNVLIANNIL